MVECSTRTCSQGANALESRRRAARVVFSATTDSVFRAVYLHKEGGYFEAAWRNGIASDYESGDCRFDPCGGHLVFSIFLFCRNDRVERRAPIVVRRSSRSSRREKTRLFLPNYALKSNPSFP